MIPNARVVRANLIQPAMTFSEEAGVSCHVYDQVKPEPPIASVKEATERFKSAKCLVADVGVGSSLDTAKARAEGSNLQARYYMSLAATRVGMAFGTGGLGAVLTLAYPVRTEFYLATMKVLG